MGALAACALICVAWAPAYVTWPFGWDQGIFATIGNNIVRGGLPYRDAWDVKGPLAYYGYAVAEWIFGHHLWSSRLLDLLVLAPACWLYWGALVKLSSRVVAAWAVVIFVLWYASLGFWDTAQPDGWVAMALMAALSPLASDDEPQARRGFAAGLLIGGTCLVKPIYGAYLLVPAAAYALSASRPRRKLVNGLLMVGLAFALPLVVAAGWFIAYGAGRDLIEGYLWYSSSVYASGMGVMDATDRLKAFITYAGGIAAGLAAAVAGAVATWRTHRRAAVVLSAWLVVSLAAVVVQGRFHGYHWIPAFPPLIALAILGVSSILATPSDDTPGGANLSAARALALAIACLTVLHLAAGPMTSIKRFLFLASGVWNSERYYSLFSVRGKPNDVIEEMRVAEYLREKTGPDEPILVWGWNAAIYFLADRPRPSRFVTSEPLTRGGKELPHLSTYRRQFLSGLQRRPPSYIVVATPNAPSKQASLSDFPELAEILERQYVLEKQIGDMDLYRRATAP